MDGNFPAEGSLIFYGVSRAVGTPPPPLIGFGMLELPWLQNDARMDAEIGKEKSAEVGTIGDADFEPRTNSDQQLRRVMNREHSS
ncbi:MAG: hypothetical protein U5P10_08865 [Spirochaetia bacterium]|nr:hypothetical protein [Spirochaetia bacterium]